MWKNNRSSQCLMFLDTMSGKSASKILQDQSMFTLLGNSHFPFYPSISCVTSREILFFTLSSSVIDANILYMRALFLDCPIPMPALSVLFLTSLPSNGI